MGYVILAWCFYGSFISEGFHSLAWVIKMINRIKMYSGAGKNVGEKCARDRLKLKRWADKNLESGIENICLNFLKYHYYCYGAYLKGLLEPCMVRARVRACMWVHHMMILEGNYFVFGSHCRNEPMNYVILYLFHCDLQFIGLLVTSSWTS